MKEQPSSSHQHVAAAAGVPSSSHHHGSTAPSSSSPDNNNGSKYFTGPCIDSEEEDWGDLGIGKLVIDLDADGDKGSSPSSSKPNPSSSNTSLKPGTMNSATSPQKTPFKSGIISETSAQNPESKGLKVKIKRSQAKVPGSTGSLQSTGSHPMQSSDCVRADSGNKQEHKSGYSVTSSQITGSVPSTDKIVHLSNDRHDKDKNLMSSSGKIKNGCKKDKSSKSERSSKLCNYEQVVGSPGPESVSLSGVSTTLDMSSTAPSGHSTTSCSSAVSVTVDLDRISMSNYGSTGSSGRRETASHDPYDFDAKDEDRIGMPMKKIKIEKVDLSPVPGTSSLVSPAVPQVDPLECAHEKRSQGVETSSVAVSTDPDCLGPCEPGTSVVLEGLVWNETNNGLLVVNVTWRGKTYVGTLMDATKHVWAPPRLNCDSPTSDFESRTPKGRNKRGRGGGPLSKAIDSGSDRKLRSNRRANATGIAMFGPAGQARFDNFSSKRKARTEPDPAMFDPPKSSKRSKTEGRLIDLGSSSVSYAGGDGVALIECPEPNCNKKYRHINGLKYHQSHAHKDGFAFNEDSDKDEKNDSTENLYSHPGLQDMISIKDNHTDLELKDSSFRRKDDKHEKWQLEPMSPIKLGAQDNVDMEDEDDEDDDDDFLQVKEAEEFKDEDMQPVIEAASTSIISVNTNSETLAEQTLVKVEPVTDASYNINAESNDSIYQMSENHVASTNDDGPGSMSGSTASRDPARTTIHGIMESITNYSKPVVSVAASANTVTTTPVLLPIPVKHDGERKKKDRVEKHEKSKNKSSSVRSIIPSTVGHSMVPTQTGLIPASTTSQLKPIQPKPTILGEPSKVSTLASLKEIKDKKQKKKKKDKDRDRERHHEKSSHEHKHKINMLSVIRSTPGAVPGLKPSSRDTTVVNKLEITVPPQLEKQQTVAKNTDDVVSSHNANQLSAPSAKLLKNINDHSLHPNHEQDAHSPAYSDISDANESAPTLEKETQPIQEQPQPAERPTSAQVQSGQDVYSPYYGQPPFLTPAVPSVNVSLDNGDGNSATPICATAIKIEPKDSLCSPQPVTAGNLQEGGERKDEKSLRPTEFLQSPKVVELKAGGSQDDKHTQNQHVPQQPGQYQQYVPYYMDQNYMKMMVEEQRRRQDHFQQQQSEQQPQHHQKQKAIGDNTHQHHGMGKQPTTPSGRPLSQPYPPHSQQNYPHQQSPSSTVSKHSPQIASQQNHPTSQMPGPSSHHPSPPVRKEQNHSPQIPRQPQQQQQQHVQQHQSQSFSQSQQHTNPAQRLLHTGSHPHTSTGSRPHTSTGSRPHTSTGSHPHPSVHHGRSDYKHNLPSQADHDSNKHSSPSVSDSKHSQPHFSSKNRSSSAEGSRGDLNRPHSSHENRPELSRTASSDSRSESNRTQSSHEGRTELNRSKSDNIADLSRPMSSSDYRSEMIRPQPLPKDIRPESSRSKSSTEGSADHSRSQSFDEEMQLNEDKSHNSVKKPPPSLISDHDREHQRRQERVEQNLREKQNENREILKENLALKEQMVDRNKFDELKSVYDNKQPRTEQELRYYNSMYQQQRYMDQQRNVDPSKSDVPVKSRDPGHSSQQDKQEPSDYSKQRPEPKKELLELHTKGHPHSSKEEDRPRSVDRSSSTSSPRATPKSKEQGMSSSIGGPLPVPYAQYYSHPYQYGGQMPFDPSHAAMYPGNPVLGYAGAPYLHHSQIRYVPPTPEVPSDKAIILSPGPPEGKALAMLQEHAQYYNAGNAPHKIHELQDIGKRAEKAEAAVRSPVPKEMERPDSRNSVGAEVKPRDGSRTCTSPPTQRHLHTHHHTHVVGPPGYPITYGPYGGQSR